ncbi:polyphosphate polymerase domain-containing protein [Halieaceae bacterium IMCC14734]|uniref:Polyphosphate polymerase domain-containing protein n=1 Tax=Candidatus Litorirhabdus singularis TaxID=2518993 RepID=A0ABT3TL74_9GAMM|nr:polyphosphate polymerase domain-containing protein [Candidatus Litorirhabdus singularis]MCX2982744.1 polyphosphate polymerase domain-containing protein [Candidatus Litorirhabdus singularis]
MPLLLDSARFQNAHKNLRVHTHPVERDAITQLSSFASHSLDEQQVVDLPDRTDSKYLLPIAILPRFLREVCADHTVLEARGHRIFTYENTYFDTPEWGMYRSHHNGKLNRYKCRFRRYRETDLSYLEIKQKNNRNRTVKNRMPWNSDEPTTVLSDEPTVEPSLYVNYRRTSLWNRATDERLTLDWDLCYRRPGKTRVERLQQVFIAELKRDGNVYGSPFVRRAKAYGYSPKSMSKYCVGVCMTAADEVKTNRFKPLLRSLDRVANAVPYLGVIAR